MSIPSPYNFVPLSNKVFLPGNDAIVSQDVPFSDGISGSFDITITAQTPIYIRNGGDFPDDNKSRIGSADYQSFFKVTKSGDYAIPGTSLRGMIRNIVEIASFAKMSDALVDDVRYGVRDLNNKSLYTKHLTTDTSPHSPKSMAGWLKRNGDGYEIVPAEFARVDLSLLDKFSKGVKLGDKQSAKDKYTKWGSKPLDVTFDLSPIIDHDHSCNSKCKCFTKRSLILRYNKVETLGKGINSGRLVFTGQPSYFAPGKRHAKHMEFIFYNSKPANPLSVPDKKFKEFIFIHSDANGQPNDEWGYWKKKLEKGEQVPVFYLTDGKGLKAMGLAMMFRLPYANSVRDAIDHTSPQHRKPGNPCDLAEMIFGFVHEKDALRGRVTFETAVCPSDGNVQMKTVETVLGSPKASYYPNYIRQKQKSPGKVGNYKTFMDSDVEIRGWKRFHVRSSDDEPVPVHPPKDKNGEVNLDTITLFNPLKPGTSFTGRVVVHNLRPFELGAIIWALTLGGAPNACHNIGMAKPYGYGTIKIKCSGFDNVRRLDGTSMTISDYIDAFTNRMEQFATESSIAGGWKGSEQIRSLLVAVQPGTCPESQFRYPRLDTVNSVNEFKNHKNDNEVLLDLASFTPPKSTKSTSTSTISAQIKGTEVNPYSGLSSLTAGKAADRLKEITNITQLEYDAIHKAMYKRGDAKSISKYSQPAWVKELEALKKRIVPDK